MKYVLSILVSLICVSCNRADDSSDVFLDVLNKGYSKNRHIKYLSGEKSLVKMIYPSFSKANFCIYGNKPHYQAKKIIKSFFDLLKLEFNKSEFLVYQERIYDCPKATTIYVKLHEGKVPSASFNDDWSYISNKHFPKLPLRRVNSDAMGFARVQSVGKKRVAFVGVNLMSNHQDSHIYKSMSQAALIQELFQVTASGRDIPSSGKVASILQESTKPVGNILSFNPKVFKNHLLQNPSGICGLDLWNMILFYEYFGDGYLYEDAVTIFRKNSHKIEKRSLEIENNPAYKGLFDPRCSGKNTGINTKIGIE